MVKVIDSHDKNDPLLLMYTAQNPHSDDDFNVFFYTIFFLFKKQQIICSFEGPD